MAKTKKITVTPDPVTDVQISEVTDQAIDELRITLPDTLNYRITKEADIRNKQIFLSAMQAKSKEIQQQSVAASLTQRLGNTEKSISKLDKALIDANAELKSNAQKICKADASIKVQKLEKDVVKLATCSQVLDTKTMDLTRKIDSLNGSLQNVSKLSDRLARQAQVKADQTQSALMQHIVRQNQLLGLIEEGVGKGNIVLSADAISINVSVAELNAAAHGTFIKELPIAIGADLSSEEIPLIQTHTWIGIEPVLSVGNTGCFDPELEDFNNAEADPKFYNGIMTLKVIFDTDVGSSKVYTIADTVTVTIKVASDSKLLGYSVADLTVMYTVIA
jgi:hypothetical protein